MGYQIQVCLHSYYIFFLLPSKSERRTEMEWVWKQKEKNKKQKIARCGKLINFLKQFPVVFCHFDDVQFCNCVYIFAYLVMLVSLASTNEKKRKKTHHFYHLVPSVVHFSNKKKKKKIIFRIGYYNDFFFLFLRSYP